MSKTHIPTTTNEGWGFFGALGTQAQTAWPLAIKTIAKVTGGEELESIAAFLDSRHGRHFADDVQNKLHDQHPLPQALKLAAQQWMGWKFGSKDSEYYGIPRGTPHLIGFVRYCGITAELAD